MGLLVIGVIVREYVETFFRRSELNVESGRMSRIFGACGLRSGFLLPGEDACPILSFFLVEFIFPLCFRFSAIFADMTALMAASAVASLDVIVQLALGLGSDLLAINGSFKIGSFALGRPEAWQVVRDRGDVRSGDLVWHCPCPAVAGRVCLPSFCFPYPWIDLFSA
jgi:hypothetical protein